MDALKGVVGLPFAVLRAPQLKLRLPSVNLPGAMTVFAIVMFTYFIFTGGIIYGINCSIEVS